MASKYNESIKNSSPLSVLTKFCFVENNKQELVFQYSKYVNGDPGMAKTECRLVKRTRDIYIFYNELENIINNLNSMEELAIHSVIKKDNYKFHIPCVDFDNPDEQQLFDSMTTLQEYYNYDIYLFKSGRSYHAYFDALITDTEWRKFLGNLLLLNRRNNGINITDTRWIGHSLIQGFSSMRLSCNTPLYLDYPTFWQRIPKRKIDSNNCDNLGGLFDESL